MQLTMLKSKIHRATVTGADLHYEGSIGIDRKLIEAANFNLFERVEIYNINNGDRFATYVIEGKEGEISLNGAAARRVQVGDLLIIASYCHIDAQEAGSHQPVIVFVDDKNQRI